MTVTTILETSPTIDWIQEADLIKSEYAFVKSFLQHMPWYDSKSNKTESGGVNEKSIPPYKNPKILERQNKLAAEDRSEHRQQKSDSKKQRREKKEANKKLNKGPGNCGSESIMQDDGVSEICKDELEEDEEKSISKSQLTKMLPLSERRAKLEKQLKDLKANKDSLPPYKWVKLIPKLDKKLGVIIKKEQKEKSKAKNSSKENSKNVSHEVNSALPSKKEKAKAAKIYNQSGNLVFNKFDFSSAGDSVTQQEKNKPKNLQKIMSSIIKEKQKIENLSKTSNVEEASERMETGLWDNALKRAGGEKVKDDANRIKKTLKTKAGKKKASAIRWNEHEKMITKLAKDRVDKKKHNIQKRKETSKKGNKGKGSNSKSKGKSKPKGTPGF